MLKNRRTLIMGVLNVTPDSFSDGGLYTNVSKAVSHATSMIKDGADIIDVGGESTRPGSLPVSAKEETDRVVPVIKAIRKKFGKKIRISIDTNKAEVASVAIKAGANMVNSLGGFMFDTSLASLVADTGVPIVIYHIKGEPRTMQAGAIKYKNVVSEVNKFFQTQMFLGKKFGIKKGQYILDPGIGFGKSVEHNLALIKELKQFKKWKLPIMVGVSRKSHLGVILQSKLGLKNTPSPTERLSAGLAEVSVAVLNGASIVRTHDVLETKRFLAVLDELV